MSEKKNFHMSPEEFRQYGRAVVDWIADYYQKIESFPVLSQVKPGQIRASLPSHAPQKGEALIFLHFSRRIPRGLPYWGSCFQQG